MAASVPSSRTEVIQEELNEIKERIPQIDGINIVTCVSEFVQLHIRRSPSKQVTLCLQFPDDYPNKPLIVELKSKKFYDKLLERLTKVCEEALKSVISKKQVLFIAEYLRNFIDDNPLVSCSEEISAIKRDLLGGDDEIKLRQKSSQITFYVKCERYFVKFKITVPQMYPDEPIEIHISDHNFPELLHRHFQAQSSEITRAATQPPIKKTAKDPPFTPRPSVLPVCKFLIADCIKYYPRQKCPLCQHKVLLDDPQESRVDPSKALVRVYCGHCFHFGCLDDYMKKPPFTGGKACPGCGKRIFHDEWRASPELAEARWAHKQARDRELQEVVEFLE